MLLSLCCALLCAAGPAHAVARFRALNAAREGGFMQAERVTLLVENEERESERRGPHGLDLLRQGRRAGRPAGQLRDD